MSKSTIFLLTFGTLLILGGGVYVWQQRSVLVPAPAPTSNTPPEVTEPTQSNNPETLDTSDWQTYRNEKYEFKYPKGWEVNGTDDPLSGDVEVKQAMVLSQNNQNILWILQVSNNSLQEFRRNLKNKNEVAMNTGENQIIQKDEELSINGVDITRIQYCSFTAAGVNCNIVRAVYFFPQVDGSYIMFRPDTWSAGNTDLVLRSIVKTFSLL